MFARASRLRIDPKVIDHGIELVRDELVPVFEELDGAVYGCWMVERHRGEVLGLTCWESLASMNRSLGEISELRASIIDAVGALVVGSEVHEVLGMGPGLTRPSGARMSVRATFVDGLDGNDRARVDDLFSQVHAHHSAKPGFVGVLWLANRECGNGVGFTGWASDEAALADEEDTAAHRREVTRELGCHVTSVKVYDAVSTAISRVGVLDLDELRESTRRAAGSPVLS